MQCLMLCAEKTVCLHDDTQRTVFQRLCVKLTWSGHHSRQAYMSSFVIYHNCCAV